MNKNFLEVAEREMEAVRVRGTHRTSIVGRLGVAIEALLQYLKNQESGVGDICFELATKPTDIVPGVKDIADKLAKAGRMQAVINDLGSWASAAQDDPGCCKELKAIFLRLLDLCDYPDWEPGVLRPLGAVGPPCCPVADEQDRIDDEMATTALDVLRKMDELISLGDLCYHIREHEAQGWEGPKVVAWGIACAQMQELFKKADATIPRNLVRAFDAVTQPEQSYTEPWPAHWPPYHHRHEPCDMRVGPCSCGAWHDVGEFTLAHDGTGTPYVERHLHVPKLPPRNFERSNFER